MKKLILLFTFIFPIAAYGEWVYVTQNFYADFYFDYPFQEYDQTDKNLAYIYKKENDSNVHYFMLSDIKQPEQLAALPGQSRKEKPDDLNIPEELVLSRKVLFELNCEIPRKQKSITSHLYDLPMAHGASLYNKITYDVWRDIPPYSIEETIVESICRLAHK